VQKNNRFEYCWLPARVSIGFTISCVWAVVSFIVARLWDKDVTASLFVIEVQPCQLRDSGPAAKLATHRSFCLG
jgi:hypothetical protein